MYKILSLFFAVFLLFSCTPEEPFEYPVVLTGEAFGVSDTSVTFTGKITNEGNSPIIESGIIWSVYIADNEGVKLTNKSQPNDVFSITSNIELLPGKTYYYRAFARSEFVTVYGIERSFKTGGNIDPGKWIIIADQNPSAHVTVYLRSAFMIDNSVYLILENGNLLVYNPSNPTLNETLTNPVLRNVDFSITHNGLAYLFVENRFYCYNPVLNSLNPLSALSGDLIYMPSGFIIGDNIYIGLGTNNNRSVFPRDFWNYDITNDSWHQSAPYPGNGRIWACSFSIGSKGYIGGGYLYTGGDFNYSRNNRDFWCYDANIDSWTQKRDLSFIGPDAVELAGTSTKANGYCAVATYLFEYNTIFDTWDRLAMIPQFSAFSEFITSDGNYLYDISVMTDWENESIKIWRYDK